MRIPRQDEEREDRCRPVCLNTGSRRTKISGAHKVDAVPRIIGRHSWIAPYPHAVVRVLRQHQRPGHVAKELNLNLGTFSLCASQVRREIGLQQTGEVTN